MVLGGAGVVAWCGWVSAYQRATTPAVLTWVVTFIAIVVTDVVLARSGRRKGHCLAQPLTSPPQPPTPPPARWPSRHPWPRPGRNGARATLWGVSPWLVLVLAALVWEVLGIDTGRRTPHLTISALAAAYRPLNAALLFVWMMVGLAHGAVRAWPPEPAPADEGSGGSGRRPGQPGAGRSLTVWLVPALLLPASRGAGVAFWLAWVTACACVDQVGRRSAGAIPTFDELLRFATRPAWANVLAIAAWSYAGWHLFAF